MTSPAPLTLDDIRAACTTLVHGLVDACVQNMRDGMTDDEAAVILFDVNDHQEPHVINAAMAEAVIMLAHQKLEAQR